MGRYVILGLVSLILLGSTPFGYAQVLEGKPFIMPVAGESNASSWILGQPYGNTTGAFVSGASSYSAGQFLHFGIDVSMPCGTPVIAVADGIVDSVDNPSRGSAPHNLLLRFPDLGLVVLYGHLLERSTRIAGQPVRQGDVVGLSGDPDGDCTSRPHLHLEVRSLDHLTAYNPIHYIAAPWHSLVGLGVLARSPFQRDLTNPRRWMSLEDQPDVRFGGRRLNDYAFTYPQAFNRREPANTLPARPFTPVSRNWQLRQLGMGGCCAGAWWHPSDDNRLYIMDGAEGQRASVVEILIDGSATPAIVQEAPPTATSADGTHAIFYEAERTTVRRLTDGKEWFFLLPGRFPALSPDNQFLLWTEGDSRRQVWVAALDGTMTKMVWEATGQNTSARWLDSGHLLISERDDNRFTSLSVLTIADDSRYSLGAWYNLRSLTIAPGGQHIIFFSAFNTDPALNGAFLLQMASGGTAQKLPWFGDYRWRDSESLFYITFDPASDVQQLHYYHILTGESYPLTDPTSTPFTIANGDWGVAPGGKAIVFQAPQDDNLWLLEALD